MISIIIISVLFIYAIFAINKHIERSVTIIFFFLCDCFYFLDLNDISFLPISKFSDYAFILILILLYKKRHYRIRDKNLSFVYRSILLLILYYFLNLVYTFSLENVNILMSIQTFRHILLLLLFRPLMGLSIKQSQKIFRNILILSIIGALIYLLQPIVGRYLLYGYQYADTDGISRYANIPMFTALYIFIYAFKLNSKWNIFIFFLFTLCLIMTLSRSLLIIIVLLLSIIIIKYYSFSQKIIFLIMFVCLGVIVSGPIIQRFSKSDTLSDIENGAKMKSVNDFDNQGTFSFRIAMLTERFDYLYSKGKLLCGVGQIHEQSPYTGKHFNFHIGVTTFDEQGKMTIEQLDSSDTAWASILIRGGLICVMLYCFLYYELLKVLCTYNKRVTKDFSIMVYGTIFFIYFMILTSLSGSMLTQEKNILIIFLLLSTIFNKTKRYEILE